MHPVSRRPARTGMVIPSAPPEATDTRAWLAGQSAAVDRYFASSTNRDEIRCRLADLWNYEHPGIPFHAGGTIFQLRRTAERPYGVLYRMGQADGPACPVLDLADKAFGSATMLAGVAVSSDGKLLGYGTSVADMDTTTWRVRDLGSGHDLDDRPLPSLRTLLQASHRRRPYRP